MFQLSNQVTNRLTGILHKYGIHKTTIVKCSQIRSSRWTMIIRSSILMNGNSMEYKIPLYKFKLILSSRWTMIIRSSILMNGNSLLPAASTIAVATTSNKFIQYSLLMRVILIGFKTDWPGLLDWGIFQGKKNFISKKWFNMGLMSTCWAWFML